MRFLDQWILDNKALQVFPWRDCWKTEDMSHFCFGGHQRFDWFDRSWILLVCGGAHKVFWREMRKEVRTGQDDGGALQTCSTEAVERSSPE